MHFYSNQELISLVEELRKHETETEWIEFKHNNYDPQRIGEYISSSANSAALCERPSAYVLWGIEDSSHNIIGTDFDYEKEKKGQQGLKLWLTTQLDPDTPYEFYSVIIDGKKVVILEVAAAADRPVKFKDIEYIRIGEHKKKLKDCVELERKLWQIFDKKPFEKQITMGKISADEVLKLLDYPQYFELLEQELPSNKKGIIDALKKDRMINDNDCCSYDITNLGAIILAKKLAEFQNLERKAIRVIQYVGKDRTVAIKEQCGGKGYAIGFEGLIDYINDLLPRNEVIGKAFSRLEIVALH